MATPGAVPDAATEGAGTPDAFVRARRQTWGLIGVVIGLSALLRFYFGPLRQDPGYHFFADTRLLGAIPRAGDVLTNIAILAAGVAGLAWWPFAVLGSATVLWWAWTGRAGADDLYPYLAVRIGAGAGMVCLLLLRRGRHTHAKWLVAAIALDVLMTVCERLDYEIFAATH